jgi:microcystin degradation protein MlrC
MPIRIALFGIYHESNTFIDKPTTIEDFKNGHWVKGNEIIDEYRDSYHEIGGMIEELEKHNVDIVPVSFAEATPGGIISATTYELLLKELTTELSFVLPVDGCIISLHGAAVSENYTDMDGHWLNVTRNLVGANKPMVGTLDPHANASQQMVSVTNALISYKTNPHIDQRDIGKNAAGLLIRILKEEIKPFQYLCPSPVAISIEQQHTDSEPCLSLYNYVNNLIAEKNLLHISINLGFPYADVEEMGTSFIVIQDENSSKGSNLCNQLIDYMKANKEKFIGARKTIDQLLPEITVSKKPVLLLDMGDNIGGGSPGNSLHLLRVFEEQRKFKSLFCVYEPDAVKFLVGSKTDQTLNVSLKDIDEAYFTVTVRVLQIVDGRFSESNPRHGGQVHYNMGTTAIVQTLSGSTIVLMSNRVPPFSLQQLTTFDLKPEQYDVIVAKGVIAPIAAYSPVCKTIFQVDTPGNTQANMTSFNYRNRRKPLFPFENIT